MSSPVHGDPFPNGSGEEQLRVLDFVPSPQLSEHFVHSLHADHPPSTPESDSASNYANEIVKILIRSILIVILIYI